MNEDGEAWAAHLKLRQWLAEARRGVRRRVYRVSQVDALLLDTQLLALLTKQLERALQDADIAVVSRRKAALRALLELAYYAWALWRLGGTPGMHMQGLRLGTSNLKTPQKILYLLIVVGVKWLWPQLKRAAIRRHRGSAKLLRGVESILNAAATFNFVLFLYGAEFPSLLLRLLGLRLEYSSPEPGKRHVANGTEGRRINFSLLNRNIAWGVFSTLALTALPMVDWQGISRGLSSALNIRSRTVRRGQSEQGEQDRCCVSCGEESPANPYVSDCGHMYCYLCLSNAFTDNTDMRCVQCDSPIESFRRWRWHPR